VCGLVVFWVLRVLTMVVDAMKKLREKMA